jgi:acyl carrier protein
MNKDAILEIVFSNVNSLVDTLPDEQKFTVSSNTVLFGKGSNIDSLSLVSLIVDLEATFADEYDIEISLTDDRAMMRKKSPFDSVQSLVDYINELVNEN